MAGTSDAGDRPRRSRPGRAGPAPRAPYRRSEEVRADLVAATVELLADRLPRDLTVREIAARAGTQHSMITRHFGSKDALVGAAVASVAGAYADAVTGAADPAEGYVRALRHLRSLPAGVLVLAVPRTPRPGDQPEDRFPGYAAHLHQLLAAGATDDLRTRVLAGMVLGMAAAWEFLDEMVMAAAEISADRAEEVAAIAESVIADVVRGALPASPEARDGGG